MEVLQVLDGRWVVAHVGGVHAAHTKDRGELVGGLGQLLGPGQPRRCRPPPACLHVDEAELPMGGDRRLTVACLGGHLDRLVEDRGALLVPATNRVDQRATQGGQRAGPQDGIAARGRVRAGPAQAVETSLHGTCRDRCAAGVELAGRRGAPAERRTRRRAHRRVRCIPQRR
jgi:hypothetical protein